MLAARSIRAWSPLLLFQSLTRRRTRHAKSPKSVTKRLTPLSPLFPLRTRIPLVTLLFPLDTKTCGVGAVGNARTGSIQVQTLAPRDEARITTHVPISPIIPTHRQKSGVGCNPVHHKQPAVGAIYQMFTHHIWSARRPNPTNPDRCSRSSFANHLAHTPQLRPPQARKRTRGCQNSVQVRQSKGEGCSSNS